MGFNKQQKEKPSLADDVVTTTTTNPESEMFSEIKSLKERIASLEITLMRILDALELSHNIHMYDKGDPYDY